MISDSNGEETAFHDGLAMVEVEDKAIPPRKGFIDKDGKLVIPARFTYVYPFSEGLAAATESAQMYSLPTARPLLRRLRPPLPASPGSTAPRTAPPQVP